MRPIINPTYLDEDVIDQMLEFYNQNGYLQIQEFFLEIPELNFLNKKNIYSPLQEKKTQYEILLQKEIIDFLEEILDTRIKTQKYCEYEHKDFILLNDNKTLENGFEVIIDFTKNWKKEFGGTLTYVDEDEEVFYLEPQYNCLTIIGTNKGLRKYLKYINNKSQTHSVSDDSGIVSKKNSLKAKNNKIKRIEIKI